MVSQTTWDAFSCDSAGSAGISPAHKSPCKFQVPRTGDDQADHRGDLPRQALGRGGDDPDEASGEKLEQGELARTGGAMAKRVLPG